jgi:hypothetical protein
MESITAVIVRDDRDGKDGSDRILVIRVDGRITHVFPESHPVCKLHQQSEQELGRLEDINMKLNREWEESMYERDQARAAAKEAQTENTALSRQLDVVVDAYECGGWNSLLDMQQLHLMREWYQDVLAVQGEAR